MPEAAGRPSPYRGLLAFREEDAPYFFGRRQAVDRLLEAVRDRPLVALLGPSGSGKSSVLFAGLLPYLRRDGWVIADFRPGSDPFRHLAASLIPLLEPELSETDRLVEARKLAAALDGDDLPLADVARRIVQKQPDAGRLLLVVDQFEELYTLCPDEAVRRRFLDALLAAAGEEVPLTILPALRADFLGRALSYRPFADVLQAHDLKLGPMNREELRDVIVRPAQKLGVRFEAGLVERILDDVAAAPGNLPLLEFALTLLWERQATPAGDGPPPLPADLHAALRAALLDCGPLDSGRALHNLFVDKRLHPWRHRLPQADTEQERAEATIAALHGQANDAGEPALLLLLHTLRDRHDPTDACHGRLDTLAQALQENAEGAPAGGLLTHAAYEDIGEVEGALARHADEVLRDLGPAEREQARRLFVQLVRPGEGTEDTRRLAARPELGAVEWNLVQQLADARLVVTGRDAAGREQVEVAHEALIQRWGRLRDWMEADRTFRAWQERLRAAVRQWQATDRDEGALLRGAPLTEAENQLEARAEELGHLERAFIEASIARREERAAEREARRRREVEQAMKLAAAEKKRAEEQVQASRRLRRRAWFLAGLLLLTAALAGTALLLNRQSQRQTRLARSRELAARADAALQTNPVTALRLAQEAVTTTYRTDGAVTGEAVAVLYRILSLPTQQGRLFGQFATVREATFSPTGDRLVTTDNDVTRLWDDDGVPLATLPISRTSRVPPTFSPTGDRLLFQETEQSPLTLIDKNGRHVATLSKPVGLHTPTFSPAGDRLLTVGRGGSAWLWDVEDGSELAQLDVHATSLQHYRRTVHFSADGKRLVGVGPEGRPRLWHGETGEPLAVLAGHGGDVDYTVFSEDGRRLLTADESGGVRLWDAVGGDFIAALPGHEQQLHVLAFSPAGDRILTNDYTETRLWTVEGQLIAQLEETLTDIAAFSPDGRYVVTGLRNSDYRRVWDADGRLVDQFQVGLYSPLPLFSPDGGYVVVNDERGRVLVRNQHWQQIEVLGRDNTWTPAGAAEAAEGGEQSQPATAEQEVFLSSLRFSPDGQQLVWISNEGLMMWDAEEAPFEFEEDIHFGLLEWQFSGDSQILVMTPSRGDAHVYNRGGELLASLPPPEAAHIDRREKRFLVDTADGWALWDERGSPPALLAESTTSVETIQVAPLIGEPGAEAEEVRFLTGWVGLLSLWSGSGQQPAELWRAGVSGLTAAALSPAGPVFVGQNVTPGFRARGRLLSDSGMEIATVSGNMGVGGAVSAATFSPDGDLLLAGNRSGQIVWHDGRSGDLLITREGHTEHVVDITFSPDGRFLATASWDDTARLWNRDGEEVALFEGHGGSVNTAAFSPGGERLLTASWDFTARLWDLEGNERAVLQGHQGFVWSALFSPDGRHILTASQDGTARLWDAGGDPVRTFEGHTGPVVSAVFSPRLGPDGGYYVLTASEDGTARLWHQDGTPLAVMSGHEGAVRAAIFHPTGGQVITGGDDGVVRRWSIYLDVDAMLEEAARRLRALEQ